MSSSEAIADFECSGAGSSVSPLPECTVSLKRNFAWTVVGNAALALCQWATLVIIAKLGTVEMVGIFAYALAVALPVAFLVHMQLRTLYVTDLNAFYPFAQVLGLRYVLASIAGIILCCVLSVSQQTAAALVVIVLVCAAQATDSISESYFAVAQRAERMDRICQSQLLRGFLSVVGLALALVVTRNLVWAAAAFAAGKLLVLLFYDAADATFALSVDTAKLVQSGRWDRFRPAWDSSNQIRLFWVVLPIGVASVLILVTGNMPRYMIAGDLGPAAVGIYAAISYLPAALMMVATALGNAAFARMSRDFHLGDLKAFLSVLSRLVAVCAALGAAAFVLTIICGRQLLLVLYRPEYANHARLLVAMMLVGWVGAVTACLGCAMSAARQFSVQVPLFAITTVVAYVGCHALIPRYGLAGAAVATGIAMTAQMVGSVLVLWRAISRSTARAATTPAPVRLRSASAEPLHEA